MSIFSVRMSKLLLASLRLLLPRINFEECPTLLTEVIGPGVPGNQAIRLCGSKDKMVMEGYVILLFNVRNIFRGK